MLSKKLIISARLLGLTALLAAFVGCSRGPVILYPITGTDYWVTTNEDGEDVHHMSDWYFNNVLKVELKNK